VEEVDPGPADCRWGEPYRCRVHCPPSSHLHLTEVDTGMCPECSLTWASLAQRHKHPHIPDADGNPVCTPEPEHICETSRCWQECQNRPTDGPRILSPGRVTCRWCGWFQEYLPHEERGAFADLCNHWASGECITTKKERRGGLLATGWRRFKHGVRWVAECYGYPRRD
jgi:hypothetical protein